MVRVSVSWFPLVNVLPSFNPPRSSAVFFIVRPPFRCTALLNSSTPPSASTPGCLVCVVCFAPPSAVSTPSNTSVPPVR